MIWSDVTKYVKNRLSLPTNFIEKTEKELIEYFKENTLRDFSLYFPDVGRCVVYTNLPKHQHPEKNNWFYFFDDLDLDIFGIKTCYFNMGDLLVTGHPLPSLSYMGLRWWALEVFKSNFLQHFSLFNFTYKFIPPNIIEVLGIENELHTIKNMFLVEYERHQPYDLSAIPPTLVQKFKNLCLADAMIWIGGIRSLYGDGRLSTPFGEIPLSGSELVSKGEDLKERILSELAEEQRPPIIIDII